MAHEVYKSARAGVDAHVNPTGRLFTLFCSQATRNFTHHREVRPQFPI